MELKAYRKTWAPYEAAHACLSELKSFYTKTMSPLAAQMLHWSQYMYLDFSVWKQTDKLTMYLQLI